MFKYEYMEIPNYYLERIKRTKPKDRPLDENRKQHRLKLKQEKKLNKK